MLNEVFSDSFAHRKNYLTEVDTRTKMLFTALAIIIIVLSRNFYVPLLALFLSLGLLLSVGITSKIILLRLANPLGIAGAILLMQVFFYGMTPIVKLNIWGFHIVGYKEGLWCGFLIMEKILGSVSLVIFLSMTTSVNKLLNTARWFKVPNAWVEIAMLSYRYIFVLLEDAHTVRDAQKVRLGYSSLARSLKSLGELMGLTVIRAYDRSVVVYETMMLRGYSGTARNIVWEEKFSMKDAITAFLFSVILASLLALNALPL